MNKLKILILLIFLNFISAQIFFYDLSLKVGSRCTTSLGLEGNCTRFSQCAPEKQSQLRADICFFDETETVVCCQRNFTRISQSPSDFTELERVTRFLRDMEIISVTTVEMKRISERKFDEYIEQALDDNITLVDSNERLLASAGKYPHMAAIGFSIGNRFIDWLCGGSLISEKFVLTAAHCAIFGRRNPEWIRIGDLDLNTNEVSNSSQTIRIWQIFVHPRYASSSYYYDIALLKLSRNVKFSKYVYPAFLWSKYFIPCQDATAMGYGSWETSGILTYQLTEMNLTILSNRECNDEMPFIPAAPSGIIRNQICAIDLDGNRDTCQGDSGGPLQMTFKKNNRTHHYLIGITSYGILCGAGYPSVYTRISSFIDWIEEIVWPVF